MLRPGPRWIALCTLVLTAATALPAWADAPPEQRTEAALALRRLESPVLGERRDAVRKLVSLLPGVRSRIIEALPGASWSVQVHLLEVLAQDGGEQAVSALLDHLRRTDETQAVRIRMSIATDPVAGPRLLAAYRRDPKAFLNSPSGTARSVARLQSLIELLRRGEIESQFVSRKSKSGSTGYYRGQYDVLRGKEKDPAVRESVRKESLGIVTGIALDEALPAPGVYTTGVYRFLRPHQIDEWELRAMALNAVAELCTADDIRVISRLQGRLEGLNGKMNRLEWKVRRAYDLQQDYNSKEYQDALLEWDDSMGEYADHLACLYLVLPDAHDALVEDFLTEVEDARFPAAPLRRWSLIAGMLIRVGWYDRAIKAYETSMGRGGSKPLGFYNRACAYASWSEQAGVSKKRRNDRLDLALESLEKAVEKGWSDAGWMNEDRDLEPLRKFRRKGYDRLVQQIRRKLALPPEDGK